jgi:hypothetical protein
MAHDISGEANDLSPSFDILIRVCNTKVSLPAYDSYPHKINVLCDLWQTSRVLSVLSLCPPSIGYQGVLS